MITYRLLKKIAALSIMWSLGTTAHAALTDISTDPLNTYSAPSSSDVKPNVLFVLDDSGSMDWDFMPDWACAYVSTMNSGCSSAGQNPSSSRHAYLFRNAAYNGIYYNPAITYTAPVTVNSSGVLDTTTYPSMTGTSSTTGGDASASSLSPNWKNVKDDAYGVQSGGQSNLSTDYTKTPYFFTTIAGEYCTSPSFRSCITASAPSGAYVYPAKLKWCNSSALTTCRAAFDDTSYDYVRSPSPSVATVTVSSPSSAVVTGITVNGTQIMAGSTASSSTASTVASRIADQINQCTASTTGNCGTYGYYAYRLSSSGTVVYIVAPSSSSFTPSVTKTGTLTVSTTAFTAGTVPGSVIPTVITSNINSYPYPGSSTKASTRTDCAGTTCTYKEEMTNYANWWTYYRTRMQMMKTSASTAFSAIDSTTDLANGVSRFRLGYMSINDNTGHDFLNLGEFAGTQKYNWYSKLLAATPSNSTPLRAALSKAGRLYSGRLDGTTLNGSTVSDPLQYSCQQNYTILSTDGFWNESSGYVKMDSSTTVGNEDGPLARPYYDGASNQIQQKTSTLQSQSITYQPQISTSQLQQQTTQLQLRTSTLQKQTSQLQKQTSQLQKQISQLQSSTSTLQKQVTQLQGRTSSLQKQVTQQQMRTSQLQQQTSQLQSSTNQLQQSSFKLQKSTKSGGTWSAYADATTCTWGNSTNCQYVQTGSWSNVSSCASTVPQSHSNGTTWSGSTTGCQYAGWTAWTAASSCTAAAPSSGPTNYTVGTATQCQYAAWTPWAGVSSCTAAAQSSGPNYTVGTAVQCQYTAWTAWVGVSSCTPAAQSYAAATATQCQSVITTPYANASSCNASGTPDGSGNTTQCQYTGWTSWAGVPSCTPAAQSSGPNYTVGTATQCQSVITSPYTGVTSCNASATPDGSGNTTQCQYTAWTPPTNTTSCTAAAQSAGPSFTGPAVACTYIVTTPFANASSCSATTSPNSSGQTTQCQYTPWTALVDVSSCTAAPQQAGPIYTFGTAVACPYRVATSYASASSCTATSTPNGSGQTTQCQYTSWTPWAGVPSCTATAQSSSPNYSVGTATQCQSVVTSPYTNTSACTVAATPDSSGFTTQCQYTGWTAWSNVSSCAPIAQSAGPSYTVGAAQQCQTLTILGTWTPASTCTTSSSQNCQYTAWSSSWTNVSSCTAVNQSAGPTYTVATARQCQTLTSGGTSDTLADVAAYYYNTDLRSSTDNVDLLASGSRDSNTTGTCTGPIISPSTTANDLCADNVPSNGRDVAATQHMTTFTLGLGSQGQMIYSPNDGKDYWNDTSGDFYDVRSGSAANSSTGVCSWMSNGSACNWPTPSSNSNANIDDLWHAAIDGHGSYFSATDPSSLSTGLTNTLSTIVNTPRAGTAAAAASSNPNVSASDNYVFSSSYKSVEWYGELIRQQINDTTGVLTAQNWSAMRLLDCTTSPWMASHSYKAGDVYRYGTQCLLVIFDYVSGATYDNSNTGVDLSNTAILHADENAAVKTPVTAQTTRTIYTKGSSGLVTFDWSNLQAEGLDSYFTAPNITYTSSTSGLTQFCASGGSCLSSSAQSNNTIATGGAAGEALVNFLRGDRTNEGTLYRTRFHVLGDIVSSEGRYVKAPLFNYTDTNYGAFKTLMASRTGAVYVGGNDGMVHAFSAVTGQELWGYVPSLVLPNMYKLADKNYSTKHQYFVDGTPETGDICPNAPTTTCTASQWKTILVGGLNRGGKGYYALDVTNPSSPQLLWEFTNANLGYSYSNPKIGKLSDGTWVVVVASGYNNADGVGRLFVLNANTGALIRTISTGVGTAASPSGLARLSTHVMDSDTDNTIVAVYGGDTFGNLWRFDVNNNIGASGYDAQLLVSFKDPVTGGNQPITVKPLEATINSHPVVFVGTGIYLGTTDVSSTQKESFYAVLDRLDTTTYSDPHTSGSGFVQQTLTTGTCPAGTPTTVCTPGQVVRTSSNNAVDWSTRNGWYIDFPGTGERSVTDPTLGLGTLLFTTITPQASTVSACGGTGTDTSASFFYALDYLTGGSISGTGTVGGASLGSGLATRPVLIELSNGTLIALVRTSGGSGTNSGSNSNTTSAGGVDLGSTSVSPGGGTDLGSTAPLTPTGNPTGGTTVQRMSWRELPNTD